MRLEIEIPDMNVPVLHARAVYNFTPISRKLASLTLDCAPEPIMQFHGVELTGASASGAALKHDEGTLTLTFNPPLAPGAAATVTVSYTLTSPPEGLSWTPESPAWPGRPAQIHTQGQPQSNHFWFPCHDFPNARLKTELVVTAPKGFIVSSNGRLVSRSPVKPEAKSARLLPTTVYETFHWLLDKTHVNYLVSLVVGKFDVVDVGSSSLPMPVYVPPGKGTQVKQTYGRTPEMIRLFSRLVDEPYPWDRYAQLVVHNFAPGGMENTSATTMYDTAILDRTALLDGDLDGLISHELAHQWFGDLLTCRSWEHIWLNEGFATYFSSLWFQERDGKDAYLAAIHGAFQGTAAADHADAPFQAAMASKVYGHPWEAFRRPANPYGKGSCILHMLRRKLGDEVFFRGLALYVDRFKFDSPETDDLRITLEEVSGLSLQRFFQQWCYRPGVPHVDVKLEWDSAASALKVSLTQAQTIDGYNPAFFFTLPIWVRGRGAASPTASQWLELEMDGREASKSFPLAVEPDIVAVDPELHVLAAWNIDQPVERWTEQLQSGPTIASKLQAALALRRLGEGQPLPQLSVRALEIAARDKASPLALRTMAIAALAKVNPGSIAVMAEKLPEDARDRKSVLEQIPAAYRAIAERNAAGAARLVDDLRSAASRDASYACRAAAVRAIADLRLPESRAVVFEAVNVESQNDQIRHAALESLRTLDDPDGLPLAVRCTEAGCMARTRPVAVEIVGALAKHNRELAFATLAALLKDPEPRTIRAVGEALVQLGDPRALHLIEEFAASTQSTITKGMAAQWIKSLQAKLAVAEPEGG
jgi:aminopeptidase N